MKKIKIFLIFMLITLLLTGCEWWASDGNGEETNSELVFTQVAQTVMAQLTLTAEAQPSQTATPTATETPTATATSTSTATALPSPTSNQSGFNPGVTSSCDEAAFVADVTIPDNTVFTPGTQFTKIWKLSNVGTCAWTSEYKAVFSSGDAMSAAATHNVTANTVANGQTVDISINMTAPLTPGEYIGNWVLRNASGQLFGIGKNIGPFYVKIVVAAQGTGTATSTVTGSTATPAPTNTPGPTSTATTVPSATSVPSATPTPSPTPPP